MDGISLCFGRKGGEVITNGEIRVYPVVVYIACNVFNLWIELWRVLDRCG